MNQPVRQVRRVFIALLGGTLVGVGVILLVLPGPGLLLIVAGFAVLAGEYAWARNWSDRLKARLRQMRDKAKTKLQDLD